MSEEIVSGGVLDDLPRKGACSLEENPLARSRPWLSVDRQPRKPVPLSPTQLQACLNAVGAFIEKRRPPAAIRDKLDYRANISGAEVMIVAVRPRYDDKQQKMEHPVARAKWVATRKKWCLYWMRADLKWHSYQPLPEAGTLDAILAEVDRDPHGCFFG